MQGTGRYSVYVANYASGNVGPHALLEMDEAASDVSKGIIALSDVAAEAGVNRYTGEMSQCLPETWDFFLKLSKTTESFTVGSFVRWSRCGRWTNPERVEVRCVL